MVKTKHRKKRSVIKQYTFDFRHHRFRVLIDKILIFRLFRSLHGRFWGLAAGFGMLFGLSLCFLIRPDMLSFATAFSDFGKDTRTAPYFAGSMFFAAYGLWHWRNYLSRTLKRTKPILLLLTITILGLYLVALMPISWKPWPYRIHLIAMAIVGISTAATVIFDILLSKTKKGTNANSIRLIKMTSFLLIVVGGWLTLGSSEAFGWFYVSLPAELMMLGGYLIWIALKTYQGEENRSRISRLLHRVILVD